MSAAGVRLKVLIPGLLLSYTDGVRTVELDVVAARDGGTPTLADALTALDARYPGLRFRIIDEQGRIRRHIRLFLGREEARDLAFALPPRQALMIVGALSGG